jgi:stage II sporulation protein D
VINSVGLEDYVAGVLEGEIPASWEAEALAAQAVASRSYALYERASRGRAPWHVTATTTHQVYADSARVHDAIRKAVERTRGEVLTFAGRPILAAFHSASGGRTAAAAEVWGRSLPYLVSRDVVGEEDSPDTYWRAGLTFETFGRLLTSAGRGVGRPGSAKVLERTPSGRVARIEVKGSEGSVVLSGRDLRRIVGESTLRSTLFDVRPETEGIVFVGTGRGHGVGMSQWGAQAMAQDGRSYPEILATFYPGTRVEHWSRMASLRP